MFPVQNIVTKSDYDELKKAYKFVIDDDDDDDDGGGGSGEESRKKNTRWQDRMVKKYHEHLYKTHVIADLTLFQKSKIGLRWRTKSEVANGKGFDSCGNKHCPCYFNNKNKKPMEEVIRWKLHPNHRKILNAYFQKCEGDTDIDESNETENERLAVIPHGLGLFDYEVHFAYNEEGKKKEELVNLKLCLRCAPKLFWEKGDAIGAKRARKKSSQGRGPADLSDQVPSSDNMKMQSSKKRPTSFTDKSSTDVSSRMKKGRKRNKK